MKFVLVLYTQNIMSPENILNTIAVKAIITFFIVFKAVAHFNLAPDHLLCGRHSMSVTVFVEHKVQTALRHAAPFVTFSPSEIQNFICQRFASPLSMFQKADLRESFAIAAMLPDSRVGMDISVMLAESRLHLS